jgi:hypothetical protein
MLERVDAQHRWLDILTALGVPAKFLRNWHGPCPMCGGKDRFRFDDKDGKGTFFCNGCGAQPRLVAGLAACSASLPRKSKHGHKWPPPRARVDTVQNRPESWFCRHEQTTGS